MSCELYKFKLFYYSESSANELEISVNKTGANFFCLSLLPVNELDVSCEQDNTLAYWGHLT